MRSIYIVHVRMTGINGGIIHFAESAFDSFEEACELCSKMDSYYEDDVNYKSYITGPILLHEYKGDSA